MQTDLQILQDIVKKYRTGLKVEDLVTIVYRELKRRDFNTKAVILNGRYLTLNGKNYQFTKDNTRETWNIKPY